MYEKMKSKVNWPITILLFIGLLTIAFPLYMAIVIAFKQPSEMTTSISGILSLPKSWSLSNFAQAMEVTDFWRSLGNSLLVTISTVVLCILLHSLMGYAVGRNKGHSKVYNVIYLFIVSGMFVPFAILMMPLAKQTAEMHLANWAGVILLYVVLCFKNSRKRLIFQCFRLSLFLICYWFSLKIIILTGKQFHVTGQ